jgi:L-glutamine-phosphate cytidylyltransferase
MDALILAAGRGTRLGHGCPKCLVELGGRTLLHRQLDTLGAVGIEDVTVVVGYRAPDVVSALPPGVRVVHNPVFATTNSLYSFLLARPSRPADVVILNADVVADASVLRALTRSPGSVIAYDSTSGDEPEHMKVHVRDGALVEMRKDLPAERTRGENLGVLRLSPAAARAAFDAAERIVAAGRHDDWLASAINVAAREHVIGCLDVAGTPWVEIDFPDDLAHARSAVLPALHPVPTPAYAA